MRAKIGRSRPLIGAHCLYKRPISRGPIRLCRTRLATPLVLLVAIILPTAGVGLARTMHSADVLRSTPSGRPTAGLPTAPWVRDENQRPGSTAWKLSPHRKATGLAGYADRVSATRGDTVQLYVATSAAHFRVQVFRMGWYQGEGARLLWTSPLVRASHQPQPTITRRTHMVRAPWTPSQSIHVDPGWPTGAYILKLADDGGGESYLPLTLRNDTSHAAVVVQNAVTTWQAYNDWGGWSLYHGPRTSNGRRSRHRARVVSFDRPYHEENGAGEFFKLEYPFVALCERFGLDVSYWTDVDLHQHPERLTDHRALMTLGHDEYWTRTMRDAVDAAPRRGVSLAFLGANAIYRHMRFARSPLGPDRTEIDYKQASEDPLYGRDNRDVTSNWPSHPVPRPEQDVVGEQYGGTPVDAPLVVTDPHSWVFAGTKLHRYDRLDHLIGWEFDHYNPRNPAPTDVHVVAHSPVRCRDRNDFADMTYYDEPNGSVVFDSGTNNLIPALASWPDDTIARITLNVIARLTRDRHPVTGADT